MTKSLKLPLSNPADIDAIVGGYHGAPHSFLGPHPQTVAREKNTIVRVFRPLDRAVDLLLLNGDQVAIHPMSKIHPMGFFELLLPLSPESVTYRLRLHDDQGGTLRDRGSIPVPDVVN